MQELRLSVVRKGYDPREVTEFVNSMANEQERLRLRVEELSAALEELSAKNARLEADNSNYKNDCVELSRAVCILRQQTELGGFDEQKKEYERRIAELEQLTSRDINSAESRTKIIEKMLADVSVSVKSIEDEARLRARTISEIAQREQTEATLAKARVRTELVKTREMIDAFLAETE